MNQYMYKLEFAQFDKMRDLEAAAEKEFRANT